MRRLELVLVVLLGADGGGPAHGPPTVSHVLAWDYAAPAVAFTVDQCTNRPQGCVMEPVATVPGTTRTVELGGLAARRSYCWRVRAPVEGVVSNIVCSA